MHNCVLDSCGGKCHHHSDAVVDLTSLKVRGMCSIYPLKFVSICIAKLMRPAN